MADNLVELVPKTKVTHESVVQLLEHVLKLARRGDLVQVVVAGSTADYATWTMHSDVTHKQLLVGALEMAKHKVFAK